MELDGNILHIDSLIAVTIGIIVLFVGKRLNDRVGFLREYSIPEPVTGGLLFSILFGLVYLLLNVEVEFNLAARDVLLVYFFTTIGINSSVRDLLSGGRPLIILLLITVVFMVAQNLVGIGGAWLFDLPAAVGVISGTVSLIGGHGTTIAWAPQIAENFGITNAMEIGIASATIGLILASLMGGPVAKFLINRHKLQPDAAHIHDVQDVGMSVNDGNQKISHLDFLNTILAIHISIIIGSLLNDLVSGWGLSLPLFVTCLFAGILLTNLLPHGLLGKHGITWPTRAPAMALIADVALGTFLAMSLMSMQLWTLVDLAGPVFTILALQLLLAVLVAIFILFPAMGRDYNAAVVCAGFSGVTLGATPTAMANMAAVTQRFGPSHQAFIIVPLVSAFFIDLANAVMIPFFLANF